MHMTSNRDYILNYIDLNRTGSPNPEGLHRTVQKQLAGSKPGGRRSINRLLRETQGENRGVEGSASDG